MCSDLFNKLLLRSDLLLTFKSYCQNEENYKINNFYKIFQIIFLSKITQ